MLRYFSVLITVICCCLVLPSVSTADCAPSYGEEIGSYRGVIARSNGSLGSCTGTGSGDWQCVEYVKRFFGTAMHFNTSGWYGNADSYYGSYQSKGLRQFAQGGTTKPKENDLLCFGGSFAGHVAIITSVTSSSITIIDQNRHATNPYKTLGMEVVNGHYTVDDLGDLYVQGWLRGYTCQWDDQSPSGLITLNPGQDYNFKVWYKNTSEAASPNWTNDGGNYSIELRSCTSTGAEATCFFLPVDGKPAWLDPTTRKRIVRASTSNIGTDGVAEFNFWGKVPSDASVGTYNVYFRPYHNSGQWIENWGQMFFQVQVVNPPPAAIPVWPVPGDYDGDGHADIAFIDHRGTGSLRIDYASNGYGGIDAQYPNYGTTPGIWSCQAEYDGDGKVDFAQLNRDYQHGTLQINYASNGFATGFDQMLDWYGTSYEIIPCPADYNGDGIGDYAQLDRLGTGVWRINYGPNFVDGFQDTFPYYGTAATIFPCPADYDGDGSSDIATLDRSATGHLKINYAANGFASGFEVDYGWYGESPLIIPYPADYNGDGVGDYAQFDRSTGYYSVNYGPNIANGFEEMLPNYGVSEYLYGAPRDYDGDGKDDIATFDQVTCVYAINYASNGFVTGHDVFLNYTAALSGYLKVATDDHPPDLPVTFALAQNYPNPFNPVTTIAYSLPAATHVTLEVFNVLGQKVSTLVDNDQAAGDHLATWDAARHASGVYLYRITTGEAVETKKMLLLK